jgi:hypothetical protein
MKFSNLKKKAPFLIKNSNYCKTKEGVIDIACRDCDFWKEDDRDYECGARALLRILLEKDVISVEEIVRAVSE